MTTDGLQITGLGKSFGGLRALDNVDLTVKPGEVHALLGQNGSGKSTLVKIMTGVYTPDPGAEMRLWGRKIDLPLTAPHHHGIAVIHQDLGLVEDMTVLENLGVTSGYGARAIAPISFRRERATGRQLLKSVGLDIDLNKLVHDLSPAERATLALARAQRLLQEHSENFVFVLDEPTAYLSAEDSQRVVALMRDVADAGSAVIFISHRLQEVTAVADQITVLRDGKVADRFAGDEADQQRIIDAMLGRKLNAYYPDRTVPTPTASVLKVRGLTGRRVLSVDFEGAPGEIVGFAGLVGMGHEEIPYLIAGATPASGGSAMFDGIELLGQSASAIIDRGVSLVPGNRQRDGVWTDALARENLALLENRHQLALAPLRLSQERGSALSAMQRFGVRPTEPDHRVGQFSGGNQQKIVLAKWMADSPRVLLLDEPTQGIDAGAKFDVLNMICDAAAKGTVVLVASGDYEQLANICHRVFIVRYGQISAVLVGEHLTSANIARHAQGDLREAG